MGAFPSAWGIFLEKDVELLDLNIKITFPRRIESDMI